ncbi:MULTISPECIES: M23 family metallopeptidase [unclassified Bosea (in: a-proteobacteria)]|uniref:M23 family metallopeptidase n=1 Tax=unclassified Bosea (in: a-proteobacteria) TaxID=2653178 RepID=UPI000955568A|nr:MULTISPECIES: M23 family metallopeptidase [unclassified Bosea (in: a-proteobacteria)]TAJ28214.1 MAG: M23 family metallopeptidase [Bosea sp. (in: a-proteobacteria)]SIR38692.1 Peptidase family M23 [Bosea sp. TND4EK4]
MNAHPEFAQPVEPLAPEAAALLVDLGIEPPIQPVDSRQQPLDRRGVSLRWLFACALVGSCGAALLGAAILVAMRGDTSYPEQPELVQIRSSSAAGDGGGARKADKVVAEQPVLSARHAMRAPMSQRVGAREVIKVRPFVRLATNLSLTSGVYASNIPPFNPLRLFAEGGQPDERYAEPVQDTADADVTIVKRDLADILIPEAKPRLSDAEVISQIEEERANANSGRQRSLPIAPQLMLSRTLTGAAPMSGDILGYAPTNDTRFSGIEVRVVPENVTNAPKTPIPASREPLVEDKLVLARRGENFEQTMRSAGAPPEQIRAMLSAFGNRLKTSALPDGQVLQVLYAPGPKPGDQRQIMRVSLLTNGQPDGTIAMNDKGQFVALNIPQQDAAAQQRNQRRNAEGEEDEDNEGGTRLYESLYETAARHDLPRPLVDELVRIFSYDLDFQQRVHGGDNLEVIFTEEEEGERSEILSASLTVNGETRRVYRYQSPEDGLIDYFDDDGKSLKKFLLRKPIAEGELRSGFGMRYHPIMRYSKMHTGVDWANRIGTPILAAGNGTVREAGWSSGYGKHTVIEHANGYVTTYSHQSNFAPGIVKGAKVRQGQVIGYLGSTGLSTGPHLHYEVLVNGNFVNPLKIRVPRGRELQGPMLAEFKRQRDEVRGLIEKAGGAVAQLR